MKKELKAIILASDCFADLEKKGELTESYYNPANIFQEIYFPEFHEKKGSQKKLQRSAGKAKAILISMPIRPWRRFMMMLCPLMTPASLAGELSEMIRKNKIDLIRCYGHRFNLVLGARLKKLTGLPLMVSLHINPDLDILGKETNLLRKLLLRLFDRTETRCLRAADLVIGVYRSIIPYLRKRKIRRYAIVYNAVQVKPAKN